MSKTSTKIKDKWNNEHYKQWNTKLKPDDYERIEAIRESKGLSRSEFLIEATKKYLTVEKDLYQIYEDAALSKSATSDDFNKLAEWYSLYDEERWDEDNRCYTINDKYKLVPKVERVNKNFVMTGWCVEKKYE